MLSDLATERNLLADELATAHQTLEEQARQSAPELLDRLAGRRPKPRRTGYGLLPEIVPDGEERPVIPQRTSYSLRRLAEWIADQRQRANRLQAAADDPGEAPLDGLVDRFEALRRNFRNIESHLSYHQYWQPQAVVRPRFFAERNRLLGHLEAWHREPGPPPLSTALLRELAPFRSVDGLSIVSSEDGDSVLPVTVVTDIEDQEFLDEFEIAVEAAFGESEAARRRRFRVALQVEIVARKRLYPSGTPEVGAVIDEGEHLGRFPDGALVLTTGAATTHAHVGRAVQLGTESRSRRSLAHEFGHLLGFSDAYLRGYTGATADTDGVVFVEWSGIGDDLMASPGHGRVSLEMIDRLLAAYGDPDKLP